MDMFKHKCNHIPTNTKLCNITSIDTVHTIYSEDTLLCIENLLFSLSMVNFQHCKLILMKQFLQICLDKLHKRAVVLFLTLRVDVKIRVVNGCRLA